VTDGVCRSVIIKAPVRATVRIVEEKPVRKMVKAVNRLSETVVVPEMSELM